MASFEQEIENAIANEQFGGCVLFAANRDGSFKYEKTFGTRSLAPPPAQRTPLQPTHTMWLASCTKLMTSISVMQLVEQGKIDLDAPVYPHIPELQAYKVLTGFSPDGSPIETPHTTPITTRQLLTHTSGLAYNGMHPAISQWCSAVGVDPSTETDLLKRFATPLAFEPGTSWSYGPSLDFAGLLVERVSGMSLEEYMKKNIWEPLGMPDVTFFLHKRADMKERLAGLGMRDDATGKMVSAEGQVPNGFLELSGVPATSCLGGQGCWASPESYFKVLCGLLAADEDEKLLKRGTVEEMFRPQLSEDEKAALVAFMAVDIAKNHLEPSGECDHGLGGVLLGESDARGARSEGTMIWGGLPNLIWFVDRKVGLTGLYATQVLPFGDAESGKLGHLFEKGVYEMYLKSKGKSTV